MESYEQKDTKDLFLVQTISSYPAPLSPAGLVNSEMEMKALET